MKFNYTLTAKHSDMHTFTQWDKNNKAIAFVRGFGKTESEAMNDALRDLSIHPEHFKSAPYSAKDRAF